MPTIPLGPLLVLHGLMQAGFEAYIVGGAVRDLFMQPDADTSISDFDFTTNATPQEIQGVFPESFCENAFGTVSITLENIYKQMNIPLPRKEQSTIDNSNDAIELESATRIHSSLKPAITQEDQEKKPSELLEITTFRVGEVYTQDSRSPQQLEWGSTLSEDLTRRDFTVNALALSIDKSVVADAVFAQKPHIKLESEDCILYDEHAGLRDLQARTLRTVGDPNARFIEDPLRMLRAVRFSVQLNFEIQDETFAALSQHAQLLSQVSHERIRDEFFKMLLSPSPKKAIELLDETGLLEQFLPELREGKGVAQAGHHTSDVWTHNLDALDNSPSCDPVVRLATLLHDISKPQTCRIVAGKPTFHNHEVVGARVAKKIAQRLALSKKDSNRIFILVRHHMFHYQPQNTDASIRRFMRKVGLEHLNDILDVREADRLGSGARKTSWRLEEMKERMREQLHQPFSVTDLEISGTDLIEKIGLKTGKIIGSILGELLECVISGELENIHEQLLDKARALAA